LRRALVFALGALIVPVAALADEGGASFWVPGQYASFAASQTEPGWSVGFETYVSKGSTPGNTVGLARGGTRVSGRTQMLDTFYVAPGYTFESDVLGGQLYLGVTLGYSWIDNQAESVVSRRVRRSEVTTERNVQETGWGLVDINPLATLKWDLGVHNLMVYATGNVPTGYFDPNTMSTPGFGFGAIDGGLGYTWDGGKGLEFSIVAGVTYNFQNPTTAYRNGIDGHIDMGASWAIADPFYVGAVGYYFHQLTADEGAPPDLGAHMSRVAGAGPQVGWSFHAGGVEVDVNVRGYAEFAAQNRPQGYTAWFTVTLSQVKKKADK
jgi:hypothetical protein